MSGIFTFHITTFNVKCIVGFLLPLQVISMVGVTIAYIILIGDFGKVVEQWV